LHTGPDPCHSDSAAKGHSAAMGELMESIFRPFGKQGSEPIHCTNETCRALNPPEAKFCFQCGAELPHKPEG
jgi:hypothetical protein